jgi:ATP-dependent DNA ligase
LGGVGCRWVKLKPEYGDETEEFDLVIYAGSYGDGQYGG